MCQMKVVVEKNGQEELLVEHATRLLVKGDVIEVEAFFEPPWHLEGMTVMAIDFLGGRVVLAEKTAENS